MTSPDSPLQSVPQGSTPVPDPTALSTAAIKAAVQQIRLDIGALRDYVNVRLDGMDRATVLHERVAGEVVGRAERQTEHLHELLDLQVKDATALNLAQHSILTTRFEDLNRLLDERYSTQNKALDEAVISQQTAMKTAFSAADTSLTAALAAAEKAVEKAEKDTAKRFDAVDDLRKLVADQASTFMPRTEADVRLQALGDRVDSGVTRNAERIREVEQTIATMPNATEHKLVLDRITSLDQTMTAHITQVNVSLTDKLSVLDKFTTERFASAKGETIGEKDYITNLRAGRSGMNQTVGMIVGFVSVLVAIFVAALTVYSLTRP